MKVDVASARRRLEEIKDLLDRNDERWRHTITLFSLTISACVSLLSAWAALRSADLAAVSPKVILVQPVEVQLDPLNSAELSDWHPPLKTK